MYLFTEAQFCRKIFCVRKYIITKNPEKSCSLKKVLFAFLKRHWWVLERNKAELAHAWWKVYTSKCFLINFQDRRKSAKEKRMNCSSDTSTRKVISRLCHSAHSFLKWLAVKLVHTLIVEIFASQKKKNSRMKRLAKHREINFWDLGFFTLAKKKKKNYFLIIVFLSIMLRITNLIMSTSFKNFGG